MENEKVEKDLEELEDTLIAIEATVGKLRAAMDKICMNSMTLENVIKLMQLNEITQLLSSAVAVSYTQVNNFLIK